MPGIILFDGWRREQLLPFTYTRPVADLRCGALTIAEKWALTTNSPVSFLPVPYLRKKYSPEYEDDNLLIAGSLFPGKELFSALQNLQPGNVLQSAGDILAARLNRDETLQFAKTGGISAKKIEYQGKYSGLAYIWDIFRLNGEQIAADLEVVNPPKADKALFESNFVNGSDFYAEEGARCTNAFIDTTSGPVWIGKNAEIQNGAMIKGPFYAGNHATIRMGAKIYGATTIGPWCKAGGEVSNSLFWGYSNKAHEGYTGDAVIGQWCNLGADTNNSNLKNNYENIKVWSYPDKKFVHTDLQFCGLFMGDHSKCGINTMFNTGTVVGVSANIFGSGFPRTYIPSFSWGGSSGFKEYEFSKALATAEKVMNRRSLQFTSEDRAIFEHIHKITQNI